MDPDPAIFVSDLQDVKKKNFLWVFLFITFWRYIYIIFQRYEVINKSQNSKNQCLSYYFCLMIEGSGFGSLFLTNPRGPKTYGSYGSGSATLNQCCGSGIRDPVHFWPPDPGSGIGFFRIPDTKPIFLRVLWQFLGKKLYKSLKIGPNFFLQHFKTKIIFNFVKFVVT